MAHPLGAQGISPKHKRLIQQRLAKQYIYSVEQNTINIDHKSDYQTHYAPLAQAAAHRHGIPSAIFMKLILTESNWNPRAISHRGAIGLTQLMPETARILGVNPHNPHQNLDGGARYLAQQYRRFQSWHLALAAYNAGPNAVKKHGGIPPYKETQNYVRKILGQS